MQLVRFCIAIAPMFLTPPKACIASANPGVHWDHLHLKSHEVLVEEFLKLGIFKGNPKAILKSGVSAAFYPHGLGHSLGMDVHDVPSASKPENNKTIPASSSEAPEFYRYLRLRRPLEEGMVVVSTYLHLFAAKSKQRADHRTWMLFLSVSVETCPWLRIHRP
jgi:hypothetical protein